MRRPLILLVVGLALAGPFVVGYQLSSSSRATTPVAIPTLVDEVRERARSAVLPPVPTRCSQLGSVDEIISALGDPYTAYLAPADYQLVRQETASTYSGHRRQRAAVATRLRRRVACAQGLRSAPACASATRSCASANVTAAKLSMAQALARILGPARDDGSPRVRRGRPQAARPAHSPRDRCRRRSCRRACSRTRASAGAIVQLSAFRIGAAVVLGRELRRARAAGRAGVRARPPPEPRRPARPGGRRVVALPRPRRRRLARRGAPAARGLPRGRRHRHAQPLVVLVDRYSASSAEIVAAALRDNRRATLVGERTFGKALVQSIDPLDNGAALELTIARYYDAAGHEHLGRRRRAADPRGRQPADARGRGAPRGAARARSARVVVQARPIGSR